MNDETLSFLEQITPPEPEENLKFKKVATLIASSVILALSFYVSDLPSFEEYRGLIAMADIIVLCPWAVSLCSIFESSES